jgi:hypothetical protein
MNKLISVLDEISLLEDIKDQVQPKEKEIKFEYYSTKDPEGKDYINNVEIKYEDGRTKSFKITDLDDKNKDSIQAMAKKGMRIVQYLKLIKNHKAPADIVIRDSKIVSISGYTLKKPYSITQVDNTFLDEIRKSKFFKSE